jgi:hypothetical protein
MSNSAPCIETYIMQKDAASYLEKHSTIVAMSIYHKVSVSSIRHMLKKEIAGIKALPGRDNNEMKEERE